MGGRGAEAPGGLGGTGAYGEKADGPLWDVVRGWMVGIPLPKKTLFRLSMSLARTAGRDLVPLPLWGCSVAKKCPGYNRLWLGWTAERGRTLGRGGGGRTAVGMVRQQSRWGEGQ